MPRIKKATIKRAWAELDRLGFDRETPEADLQLNAAALVSLARFEPNIAWRRRLPDSSALEFEGRAVMLTFRPGSEFSPGLPVSPPALAAAKAATKGRPETAPLECLALKALEPNFEWLAEPVFPELEEASAGSASS